MAKTSYKVALGTKTISEIFLVKEFTQSIYSKVTDFSNFTTWHNQLYISAINSNTLHVETLGVFEQFKVKLSFNDSPADLNLVNLVKIHG